MNAVEHAAAAAESVRALNRATVWAGDPDGYRQPADLDAVVAELGRLATRLPQAVEQAAGWLEREHAAGQVGLDYSTDPAAIDATSTAAVGALRSAAGAAAALAAVLDSARMDTAHLTGVTP